MPRNLVRALSCALVFLLGGCRQPADQKVVVLFADASASITDRTRFHDAWTAITDTLGLRWGDRLVVARLDGATYDHFRPVLNLELPSYDPYVDNELVASAALIAARRQLEGMLDAALAGPPSQRTDVLGTLALVPKIVAGDTARHHRIILLSDMLQDDGQLDFSRTRLSDRRTDSLIAVRRRDGQLPDLRDDTVIVVGATNRPDVQRFWMRYVKAAGGVLRDEDYGPALVHYRW